MQFQQLLIIQFKLPATSIFFVSWIVFIMFIMLY